MYWLPKLWFCFCCVLGSGAPWGFHLWSIGANSCPANKCQRWCSWCCKYDWFLNFEVVEWFVYTTSNGQSLPVCIADEWSTKSYMATDCLHIWSPTSGVDLVTEVICTSLAELLSHHVHSCSSRQWQSLLVCIVCVPWQNQNVLHDCSGSPHHNKASP